MLLFWSALIVDGRVVWLRRWERWEGGDVGKVGKVGGWYIWEVGGWWVVRWETQNESKISTFCF